jgi:rRNA-processing protein FCF1
MRVVLVDTNIINGHVIYDLKAVKQAFRRINQLKLLIKKTTEDKLTKPEESDVIGIIKDIKIHNGVFRGNIEFKNNLFKDEVEAHIKKKGRVHLATNVDADFDEDEGLLYVNSMHGIYYAYLSDSTLEKRSE